MIKFPEKAFVGRIIPKEAFYRNLNLGSELKDKFVSDIKRICVDYKLAPDTINVEKSGNLNEILVLSVELKDKKPDYRIFECIARTNAHKLLFLLKFEDNGQLAIYHGKLYKTDWMPLEDLHLEMRGFNLDNIWEGFIEQIALNEDVILPNKSLTIDEKLEKQKNILKLQREIDKLERLLRTERQPRKRFDLYMRLQTLKKILAVEKENEHGKDEDAFC